MYMNHFGDGPDKVDRLIACFGNAVVGLMTNIAVINLEPTKPRPAAANDNDQRIERPRGRSDDLMPLEEVPERVELGKPSLPVIRTAMAGEQYGSTPSVEQE